MQIVIQPPMSYEADVSPPIRGNLTITPRFFRKQGQVPILPITTISATGNELRYMIFLSATKGSLHCIPLAECVPECDTVPKDKPGKPGRPKKNKAESDSVLEEGDTAGGKSEGDTP